MPPDRCDAVIDECRELTGAIFEGLDVEHEIRAVLDQDLGEIVLVDDASGPAGFAVCHCGAGEAGSSGCFVKFAAVRPGPRAGEQFESLLEGVKRLASARGVERITAGTDVARRDAYRRMLAQGFRSVGQGVRMHRPDAAGYCGPGVYVIDDLR